MNMYTMYKREKQLKINNFPMMFAFSKEQLENGKNKVRG